MSTLIARIQKWLREQQDRQYLAQSGSREIADLGISTTDLETLAASPGDTRQRMEAMAKAHGLDADLLDSEHWRQVDMARACGQCGDREQCRRWLGGKDVDTPPSEFCPNARHFAELALKGGVSTMALESARDSDK